MRTTPDPCPARPTRTAIPGAASRTRALASASATRALARRGIAAACVLAGLLATASPALAARPAAPAPLSPAAAQALGRSVGAALATAGAGTVAAAVEVEGYGGVYRRNSSRAVPPASTQKSFTALSVLLARGPDARLRTEVAATTAPVAGVLPGSLWLVGGGDPYLTTAQLRTLAADVRAAGITQVTGDLLLDDSRYDARRSAAGWKPSFLPVQSGPLSALAVDRNSWRRDAAYLADPALPAAGRFRDLLRAAGVTVDGSVARGPRPAGAVLVAVVESAPLSLVVRRALKASDNFAAELLLKEIGRTLRADGSSAAGIAAQRQLLGALGVPTGAAADGSGLSSLDRQTPRAQVALLRAAGRSPVAASFRAALPVGCVDGTLRRRFCRTPAAGRVQAKTGTLAGVRTLAGYTTTASGRPVVFAFQLSRVPNGPRALAAMDRAVVLLAQSRS